MSRSPLRIRARDLPLTKALNRWQRVAVPENSQCKPIALPLLVVGRLTIDPTMMLRSMSHAWHGL